MRKIFLTIVIILTTLVLSSVSFGAVLSESLEIRNELKADIAEIKGKVEALSGQVETLGNKIYNMDRSLDKFMYGPLVLIGAILIFSIFKMWLEYRREIAISRNDVKRLIAEAQLTKTRI